MTFRIIPHKFTHLVTIAVLASACACSKEDPVPVQGGEAVDMGLSVKWFSCNLGSPLPEELGDYYAWAETEFYYKAGQAQHNPPQWNAYKGYGYDWPSYKYATIEIIEEEEVYTLNKYNTLEIYGEIDNKTVVEWQDDAASIKLGSGWRLPTKADWEELMDETNCSWSWTQRNGHSGYLVTSKKNGNSIFLPAAGNRAYLSLSYTEIKGCYWSSSLRSDKPYYSIGLSFDSANKAITYFGRYYGLSIRAVSK